MYELVGDIVEEKELDGRETINELLGKFTQKGALIKPNGLLIPGIYKNFKKETSKKQELIVKHIGRILENMVFPYQEEDTIKALDTLALDFICLDFGLKYDEISKDLLFLQRKIKRGITFNDEYNNKEYNEEIIFEIPLFANSNLGGSKWSYNVGEVSSSKNSRAKHKILIESKTPPITKEAKEKLLQAKADFYEIYAKALRQEVLGTYLMTNMFRNNLRENSFSLDLYWIPSNKDLNINIETTVMDPDPFVLASIYGIKFLVAAWDVKGEIPYQHYLEEYKIT